MKVKDLVEQLKKMDPELPIRIWLDDDSSGYGAWVNPEPTVQEGEATTRMVVLT